MKNLFFVFILLIALTSSTQAEENRALTPTSKYTGNEKRTALVIGNSTYLNSPLKNPSNDAKLIAKILQDTGFKVNLLIDASQNNIKRAIDNFGSELRSNKGVGLFYYAGHGIQLKSVNYLIPVNANITSEEDIEYESINIGRVISKMYAAKNRVNIIILDACRNNPFARSYRSPSQGLASLDAPAGSFIAYATGPGQVAEDGSGDNSLFTKALANSISLHPGASIENIFKKVRENVRQQTNGRQLPWTSSSLIGEFLFNTGEKMAVENEQDDSLNLDDIKAQVEREKQAATNRRAKSEARLQKMEADFKKIQDIMSDDNIEYTIKKTAWKRFMRLYPEDFSWTEKDNLMRTYAENIIASHHDAIINMPFVNIKGGCFKMGDGFGDGQFDEQPSHLVCLKDFYISKFEVTNKMFRKFKAGHNSGNFKGYQLNQDKQPVVNVTWEEANAFAEWLSRRSGQRYRLPTEAEWEYVARAGIKEATYWGLQQQNACRYANVADLAIKSIWKDWRVFNCFDRFIVSAPVGMFAPNNFGVNDMLGNVWEWTNDWYEDEYYARSPKDNPQGPVTGSVKSVRGGSWYSNSRHISTSKRNDVSPDGKNFDLGFRLVMEN